MEVYKLAQKYLSYIRDRLGVSNDRIIICCGNHDVNRNSTLLEKIDCDIREISTSTNRFEMFNQFCKNMGLEKCCSDTYFREDLDGFNFLVANSNFNDDKSSGLCTSCCSIKETISKNKSFLLDNVSKKRKAYNIFVSHSPWTDFCEYFNYEYPENEYNSRLQHIREFFGGFYAGDKHSNFITGTDYLMGAPLSSDQITYGIYDYDDDNKDKYGNFKTNCRRIKYKDDSWNIYESNEEIDEIVEVSLKYIKNSGIHMLYGVNNIDVNESIENLEHFKENVRWKEIDSFFRSFITLQKPCCGQAGKNIEMDEHIIDYIVKLINNEKCQYPIVLRGNPKLGKSTLLTITYINMLYCFMRNSFDYIPIYHYTKCL